MTDSIGRLVSDLDATGPVDAQERAVRELIALGPAILPSLWVGTGKRHWRNVVAVVRGIGYPANAAALPSLVLMLQDLNWPGSAEAAEELRRIGGPILPHIRTLIVTDRVDYRWMAGIFWMLKGMEPIIIAPVVPDLLEFLRVGRPEDPDWDADEAAIRLLGHLASPYADDAIPVLSHLAGDVAQPPDLRIETIEALGRFDATTAIDARAALMQCLQDSSEAIRNAARGALDRWEVVEPLDGSGTPTPPTA